MIAVCVFILRASSQSRCFFPVGSGLIRHIVTCCTITVAQFAVSLNKAFKGEL